ncbi:MULTISPECIES: hypothetical protein [Phaeobacter]|uniref:GcrA cell cycle regulator n=1 Tax=Phaeobacter piscinae TaxID=1580596 RepID=A0ABN5DF05_9RHOB|nr:MULTISPECIES: hypothetical protein [Phaeobacter]ATG35925.1 GcrA cell cycle regulator [Phaeobacter piscinae]AUQ86446.1 GcrA cell cycle regulator [Phaeobacter piscinae]AUR24329.1 GcrA cell cycle regulator [Phaeobacter piscinae]UWR87003.1 hypothetical protein K4L01_09425 [Phaeobacter inhibens]
MPRPLANITKETLAPLWGRHDIPTERIATALGVTRQAVSYKAKSLGLPSRAKVRRCYVDNETFTRMWNAGVCTSDMAAHFGYTHRSAIGARRRILGLPARTRGKGGTNSGGWHQTISLTQFFEAELAAAMHEAAQQRKTAQ